MPACSEDGDGDPVVGMSPHSLAPLSGVAAVSPDGVVQIEITVMGEIPITSVFTDVSSRASLPIVGLYPGRSNTILLEISDADGNTVAERYTLEADAIPDSARVPEVTIIRNSLEAEDSLLFFVSGNGADFIFDKSGEIRWYLGEDPELEAALEEGLLAGGLVYSQLENGNLALGSKRHATLPYWFRDVLEMDFSGQVINRYEIEEYVHHAVVEDSHHNLVVATSAPGTTSEDVAIIIDRDDGSLKSTFDFGDLLQ